MLKFLFNPNNFFHSLHIKLIYSIKEYVYIITIINARKTNTDFTTYLIKFSETLLIFLNARYY